MKLYVGIDLRADHSYVVIIGEDNKVIYQKPLTNNMNLIEQPLSLYQERIDGIVERSHGTDKEEFYQMMHYKNDVDLEKKIRE